MGADGTQDHPQWDVKHKIVTWRLPHPPRSCVETCLGAEQQEGEAPCKVHGQARAHWCLQPNVQNLQLWMDSK